MRIRRSVLFLVLVILLMAPACAHRTSTTPSGTGTSTSQVQVTPWEQVMVTNGIIASTNKAVLQGVIAANQMKNVSGTAMLPDNIAKEVITLQGKIAANHNQLTKILSQGPDAAKGQTDQINNLVSQIRTAADQMIQSGNLNVKSPTSQFTIQASVDTILTMTQLLLQNLQAAGVGK